MNDECFYFMLQVLHTAAKEMLNYQGLGYGVMGENVVSAKSFNIMSE